MLKKYMLEVLRNNRLNILFVIILGIVSCKGKPKTDIKEISEINISNESTGNVIVDQQNTSQKRKVTDYKKLIELFKGKILNNQNVSNEVVELLIPLSEDEYLELYSLTFPSNNHNKLFQKIDSAIGRSAIENRGNCLALYLKMSEYVDGEYAESYFEDVDFIIGKNKDAFCVIYDKGKMKRLKDFYIDYCKNNKR